MLGSIAHINNKFILYKTKFIVLFFNQCIFDEYKFKTLRVLFLRSIKL